MLPFLADKNEDFHFPRNMAPLQAEEKQANAPLEHVEKNTAFILTVTLWDPHQTSAGLQDKRFMLC